MINVFFFFLFIVLFTDNILKLLHESALVFKFTVKFSSDNISGSDPPTVPLTYGGSDPPTHSFTNSGHNSPYQPYMFSGYEHPTHSSRTVVINLDYNHGKKR